jgi:hypothetical protein
MFFTTSKARWNVQGYGEANFTNAVLYLRYHLYLKSQKQNHLLKILNSKISAFICSNSSLNRQNLLHAGTYIQFYRQFFPIASILKSGVIPPSFFFAHNSTYLPICLCNKCRFYIETRNFQTILFIYSYLFFSKYQMWFACHYFNWWTMNGNNKFIYFIK